MSYVSDRERERFRELLRRAATEDSQRLHPDRGETDATEPTSRDDARDRPSEGRTSSRNDRSSRPDSACHGCRHSTDR